MKVFHAVAAAALALFAFGANAQSITSVVPGSGYTYGPLTFNSGTMPFGTTNVSDSTHLAPLGVTGDYSFISTGGSATILFAPGVSSFSFLWGSPDSYNSVLVNNVKTFTGFDVVASPSGLNSDTRFVTISNTDGGLSSLVFTASNVAFELASVTPVPEPETYALMLAGLGVVGFMARRRKIV